MVAYSDSNDLYNLEGLGSNPRPQPFLHAVILDSQVAGNWKRTLKKDTVLIEVRLFVPFDDGQMAVLETAAGRYGRFVGRRAMVTLV